METPTESARLNHQSRSKKLLGRASCAAAILALSSVSLPALAKQYESEGGQTFSIGAGFRSQFQTVEGDSDFTLPDIRVYTSGQLSDTVKFTFNLQQRDGDTVDVLDAIAQFEFTPEFNIWVGHMLTPADRIEMSGPYYALSWNQYRQPLYASDQGGQAGLIGRDEGVTFWGTAGKFQYAVGTFAGVDGFSNEDDNPLYAARFAYNFLNMESNPGYYTSSTYYGGLGNIFTLALSMQSQEDGVGSASEAGDFSGWTIDMLSETVLGGGGVVTVEGEYKSFDADYTLASMPAADDCFCLFDGESVFATAAYLFPNDVGPGKLQPYLRLVENRPSDASSSSSTELGLNYVVNGHNTRLNLSFVSGDANASGYAGDDVDVLSLGMQVQL
ncbi:hypothetical protein KUV95_01635 [Microbulbifer agarilyticus]|uniref:hypothetical protein n=1 Tax=Microbulbifer agarilyticus TaxID=260552 RepID=UPI001C93813D|nr:hypothetical protein [Microbulbifer agarilyticus]MBY6210243.1 hypothetical protein [Microbulbifer agarilyticus]